MCTYLQRMLSTLTRKLMQKPPVHKRQQQIFFFMRRKIKSKSYHFDKRNAKNILHACKIHNQLISKLFEFNPIYTCMTKYKGCN